MNATSQEALTENGDVSSLSISSFGVGRLDQLEGDMVERDFGDGPKNSCGTSGK